MKKSKTGRAARLKAGHLVQLRRPLVSSKQHLYLAEMAGECGQNIPRCLAGFIAAACVQKTLTPHRADWSPDDQEPRHHAASEFERLWLIYSSEVDTEFRLLAKSYGFTWQQAVCFLLNWHMSFNRGYA